MYFTDLTGLRIVGWIPWAALWGGEDPRIVEALDRKGVYVLARFRTAPAEVDLADEQVFYVGETHGRTTCLTNRLYGFAKSAGFLPGGQRRSGHYAACRFPEEIRGRDGLPDVGAANVFVALVPYPMEEEHRAPSPWPLAARGVFPGLVEAVLLWRFVRRNGRLPYLNNSGYQGQTAEIEPPILRAEQTGIVLDGHRTRTDRMQAARVLAEQIAHLVFRGPFVAHEQAEILHAGMPWQGVSFHIGGAGWAYLGWKDTNPPTISLSVWYGEECWFGTDEGEEAPASTHEGFQALFARFFRRWNTE